jgi:hypothetical protein
MWILNSVARVLKLEHLSVCPPVRMEQQENCYAEFHIQEFY